MDKPDLPVRTTDPLSIEGRVDLLIGHETPVEHFFLHSYGAIPEVDVSSWRLTVDGLVATPLSLDYRAVTALPAETRRLVLECAGNGGSFFDSTPADAIAWGPAALGQARWTGTRLDALLDHAGLAPDASHVIFHALDTPKAHEPPFLRSLSIDDLRARGAILAWAMGGDTLLPPHGFPLRVVVPGWAGQHWVKWLTRIQVAREPARGLYMDDRYRISGAIVRGGQVKSLITWPADGARLRHRMLGLSGIAWAGEDEVARVEATIDGGATWRDATLSSHGGHGAWRRWDLNIQLEDGLSGELVVAARATDDAGRTQPERAEWNPRGYLWNGYHTIRITRVP